MQKSITAYQIILQMVSMRHLFRWKRYAVKNSSESVAQTFLEAEHLKIDAQMMSLHQKKVG